MTKSIFEFMGVEARKEWDARQYTIDSNQYLKPWTVLISTDNLREAVQVIWNKESNHLDDAEKIQL